MGRIVVAPRRPPQVERDATLRGVHNGPAEFRGGPAGWVALGDSYTIGTSVAEPDRWPNQLLARLPAGRLRLLANLAVNGATSRDVIERQLPRLVPLRPTFAKSRQLGGEYEGERGARRED